MELEVVGVEDEEVEVFEDEDFHEAFTELRISRMDCFITLRALECAAFTDDFTELIADFTEDLVELICDFTEDFMELICAFTDDFAELICAFADDLVAYTADFSDVRAALRISLRSGIEELDDVEELEEDTEEMLLVVLDEELATELELEDVLCASAVCASIIAIVRPMAT